MKSSLEPAATGERAPKIGEAVASTLRGQIIRGEITQGDMLPPEAELLETFGVSRPSLREALRILESEGMIVMHRGMHGGARAARPSIDTAAHYIGILMQARKVTLADVFDARIGIEPIAVRILAERRSRASAVRQLREILQEELDSAHEPARYTAANLRFHQELVRLSGNQTLGLVWATLQYVLTAEVLDLANGGGPDGPLPATVAKRQELCNILLDLIAEGKAEAAEEFWHKMLSRSRPGVVSDHADRRVVDVLGD